MSDQTPLSRVLSSVRFSAQPLTQALAMTLHQAVYEPHTRGDAVRDVAGAAHEVQHSGAVIFWGPTVTFPAGSTGWVHESPLFAGNNYSRSPWSLACLTCMSRQKAQPLSCDARISTKLRMACSTEP